MITKFQECIMNDIRIAGSYKYNKASVHTRYKDMLTAKEVDKQVTELVTSGQVLKVVNKTVTNGRYSTFVYLSLKA